MVRHSPAAQRNKEPILEVLRNYLAPPETYRLLEVASGSGTHGAHLARHLPNVTFTPTEVNHALLPDIVACVKAEGTLSNVSPPLPLDASSSAAASISSLGLLGGSFDAVLCINMIHISPYRCTEGLFELSGALLHSGGRLFTYGPYGEDGVISPDSNVAFDATLRRQCADWGIRDVRNLEEEASKNGLGLEASHQMPANNKLLAWKKM